MRKIKYTNQFKRDYKREKAGRHHKTLDDELRHLINLLLSDSTLEQRYKDHPLKGEWKDHRDCHVRPDLVLIYSKPDNKSLILVRLGSHVELGW
jgi:mRNA interferase YafQ